MHLHIGEFVMHLFVSALFVFAAWKCMSEDMIFARLGSFFKAILPESLHKPVFDCPICMFPWYGTPFWLLVIQPVSFTWYDTVAFITCGVGLNTVILALMTKCEPKKQEEDEWI